MPTGHPERRWEGSPAALILLLVLVASGLVGCSLPFGDDDPPADPARTQTTLDTDLEALLARRARAVRSGNLTAFLDGVDSDRSKFRARQERYFLNLRELPLAAFRYSLEEGVMTLSDGRVQGVVQLHMRLEGYDALPVRTAALFTFRHLDSGAWVLSEDRNRAFERDNDIEPQPWDLMRIQVKEGDGVLGIFDEQSIDAAYQIIDEIEDGIRVIEQEVPLKWSGRVVVYALSDLRVLSALDDLPGGDPNRLDGVAFPVRASPESPRLAAIRFMLHPRMIYRNDESRSRLVRHELTHVAIGRRDDRVPTWLSEGLAEYVSVQPIVPYERMISREALEAAQAGVEYLPLDTEFNGRSSGANYGLAWYACEYIAQAFGEKTLWRLFDVMRSGDGTPETEEDAVLEQVLGIDGTELAKLSARKIVNTFG
jgi:hypothetical protein